MYLVLALALAALVSGPLTAQAADRPAAAPARPDNLYRPPKPKDGYSYPDCFCTDSTGQRVEMGQTACLSIGAQSFTARCAMSVNNPIWRRVGDGCPGV